MSARNASRSSFVIVSAIVDPLGLERASAANSKYLELRNSAASSCGSRGLLPEHGGDLLPAVIPRNLIARSPRDRRALPPPKLGHDDQEDGPCQRRRR